MTFATALCGALAAAAVLAAGSWRRAVPLVLLAVAMPVAGPLLPVGAGEGRPVTVALVQGNVPGVGMDPFGEREQVLRNHVDATHRLAADVRAGRVDRPDLVVWPENASDIDPFRDPSAQALIEDAVRRRRCAGARRGRAGRAGTGPREQHRHRLGPADRPGRALREAAPGAVRRVHPVPRRADRPDLAAGPDPAGLLRRAPTRQR